MFLSSYLSCRTQRVKIMDFYSQNLFIPSGVPQGAILSPLLFNSFINDLYFGEDCKLFKYADDTTIVIPHYTDSVTTDIECKVNIMEKWCTENSLFLNKAKTQIMTNQKNRKFKLHQNHTKEMRILGVCFNENFKWDSQINRVCKKAAQNIHILA